MKKPIASFLSCLGLLLVTACGGAGASAAGTYDLDPAPFRAMMEKQMQGAPADAIKKQLDTMMAGLKGSIELKADGTASMTIKMPPIVDESTTGTWKVEGDKITMVTKDKNGKEETKTAKFADGAITVEEDQGGQKMVMIFRRK